MARQRAFDREKALESAILEFWRHGYEATSVARLTEAMGIRPPSLYAAFGDKRQLFEEAVLHYRATYGAFTPRALAEEPTGRRALERVLMEAAAEFTDPAHPHGCMVVCGAANVGPESAEVDAWLRTFREEGKAAFQARIEQDVAAGSLPSDTDSWQMATFYAAVFQGMSTQARDGATREELEAVARQAMRAWP
jgi:TetR/AcrR family transcriptional regulator, copper-responsive repressor